MSISLSTDSIINISAIRAAKLSSLTQEILSLNPKNFFKSFHCYTRESSYVFD
jgi:hypothetical protein